VKQRQHRRDNVRLDRERKRQKHWWYIPAEPQVYTIYARSKQLLVMSTESLADQEWLPGELLSGSECSKVQLAFV